MNPFLNQPRCQVLAGHVESACALMMNDGTTWDDGASVILRATNKTITRGRSGRSSYRLPRYRWDRSPRPVEGLVTCKIGKGHSSRVARIVGIRPVLFVLLHPFHPHTRDPAVQHEFALSGSALLPLHLPDFYRACTMSDNEGSRPGGGYRIEYSSSRRAKCKGASRARTRFLRVTLLTGPRAQAQSRARARSSRRARCASARSSP